MKKLLIVLLIVLVFTEFVAAGSTTIQMSSSGQWSQTLKFSVKHKIVVTWEYDVSSTFLVDYDTGTASVGDIQFWSNKKFKLYYAIGNQLPTGLGISAVQVGTQVLSDNANSPTEVPTKSLAGVLSVTFTGYTDIEDDFDVKLDFTFLPF
ncbi:hypothetical protein MNL76_02220 [Fervidobacterium riparium]|uniref:Secreted protein n=1 Tax=Fervidobacterium gondwanense DSM 13020 TaxID=1121883 RepID=A0A1M7SQ90_FERGO|nr:hypothetical protein [Fervidobacterium gondwanense]UXF00643.1 hypothetical protein IB67_03445 [Fervidobacterium riparium]SHN60665.1 hypothetical protein SAMN02745226_01134 [Fervidobacterium gondwanense DSM 13020]